MLQTDYAVHSVQYIIGEASCPPAELESPEGPVYDRDHAQFEETDRSENWENFKKIMCVLCRNRC